MAQTPAVRKAARAAKRKAEATARQAQAMAANSQSGRVREGAALPIRDCMVSAGLFENGMGAVYLSRGASTARQFIALFMVDSFALGVKELSFRVAERDEAEFLLDAVNTADALTPTPPEEARKLLRDVVAWANGSGFAPPKTFAAIEALFGDVVPAETDYAARCGKEGKVLYIPGPSETPAQIKRRMKHVEQRFGIDAALTTLAMVTEALKDE